jgi:hypothetical protein
VERGRALWEGGEECGREGAVAVTRTEKVSGRFELFVKVLELGPLQSMIHVFQ